MKICRWLLGVIVGASLGLTVGAKEGAGAVFSVPAASPGDAVEVTIAGVDPQAVTTAHVGTVEATILSRGVASVTIEAPAGATSAAVTLTSGGNTESTPMELLMLRPVTAHAHPAFSEYSLVASVFAPFYYGLLFGTGPVLLAILVMSGLLMYRHRQNIANLMAGKESRIGSKKK